MRKLGFGWIGWAGVALLLFTGCFLRAPGRSPTPTSQVPAPPGAPALPFPRSAEFPPIRADGDWIAYRGTDGGLWLIRPNGSDRQRIYAGEHPHHLVWSPDGARIAFVDGNALLMADLPSGGIYRLVYLTGLLSAAPAWHPKGLALAYGEDWTLRVVSLETGHVQIRARDLDPERCTEDPFGCLAWSGDGRSLLYFQADPQTGRGIGLARIVLGEEATPRVLQARAQAFALSPDGQRLVWYERDRALQWLQWIEVRCFEKVDPSCYPRGFSASVLGFSQLRWSPDGQWILGRATAFRRSSAIWLIRLEPEAARPLPIRPQQSALYSSQPWSPDGRKLLLFLTDEREPRRIQPTLYDMERGTTTPLPEMEVAGDSPEAAWGPGPTLQGDQIFSVPLLSLEADPTDPHTVYALRGDGTLYRSANRGRTWMRLASLGPAASDFALAAVETQMDLRILEGFPSRMLARVGGTLYRSGDGGRTWEILQAHVQAWATGPDGQVLYVWRSDSESRGLYRSADGGRTWERIASGPIDLDPTSLAWGPRGELYAATAGGFYRSLDGGRTWAPFAPGLPPAAGPVRLVQAGGVFALVPVKSGERLEWIVARLIPAEEGPEADRWEILWQGPGAENGFHGLYAVRADPLRPDWIYLGTEAGLQVRSGEAFPWRSPLPLTTPVYRIAVAREIPPLLYLWTAAGWITHTVEVSLTAEGVLPAQPRARFEPVFQRGGELQGVAVSGTMTFIGVGPRVQAVDVRNPSRPRLLGESAPLPGLVRDLAAFGNVLLVAASEGGVRVLDLSDPGNLREIHALPLQRSAWRIALHPPWALIGAESELYIVDLHHPTAPSVVSHLSLPGRITDIEIGADGRWVYVSRSGGLSVVDLQDPAHPQAIAQLSLQEGDLLLFDRYLYVASGLLNVVDVKDPRRPRILQRQEISPLGVYGVLRVGRFMYAFGIYGESGFITARSELLDLSQPENPRPVGTAPVAWWSVAQTGRTLYSISPTSGSLEIWDVRRPSAPRRLGTFRPALAGTLGRIQTYGTMALVASEKEIHLLELSDPAQPISMGSITGIPGAIWKFVVKDNQLAVWTLANELYIFDFRPPARPTLRAVLTETTGTVPLTFGDSWAVESTPEGLRILDLRDPASPREIGRYRVEEGESVQMAIGVDRQLFMVSASYESAPVFRILDLQDPARPVVRGQVVLPPGAPARLLAQGTRVLVTGCCPGWLAVIETRPPEAPRLRQVIPLPGSPAGLAGSEPWIAVAAGEEGVWMLRWSVGDILRVIGRLDTPGLASDVAFLGKLLLVSDGPGGFWGGRVWEERLSRGDAVPNSPW